MHVKKLRTLPTCLWVGLLLALGGGCGPRVMLSPTPAVDLSTPILPGHREDAITPTPLPAATLPPLSFQCASAFTRQELKEPYQHGAGGKARFTLSEEELEAYLSTMGIESLCIPVELGAPFLNVDWHSETSPATTGRMISLGFESLYAGSGWSDGYLVHATYDFATGSEYDRFASWEDHDTLRSGTMPDTIEVDGVSGFVRFQRGLCYGSCWMYRTIVFPFENTYLAVVYKVGGYEAEADLAEVEQTLRAGGYPVAQQRFVAAMDHLARSLRFAPAAP